MFEIGGRVGWYERGEQDQIQIILYSRRDIRFQSIQVRTTFAIVGLQSEILGSIVGTNLIWLYLMFLHKCQIYYFALFKH